MALRRLALRSSLIVLLSAPSLPLQPVSAQFGGICGRRDGCGVAENDFRVRDPASEGDAAQHHQQIGGVNRARRAGNLEEAIRLAEQALAGRNDPSLRRWIANTRAILHSRAANTALRNGEYRNALALYERALENPAFLPPQLPDFLYWLRGEIALRDGDRTEAIRLLRLGSRTPWTSGAESQRFLSNLEAEERAATRWNRNIAEGRILAQRGIAQFDAGDFASAARTLAEAERLAPDDRGIANRHRRASAELAYRRGELSTAIDLLGEAFDDAAAVARRKELQQRRDSQTGGLQQALDDTMARISAPTGGTDVVDARGMADPLPSYVPRPAELENSPGSRQWQAGMRAAVARDWVLALAYFRGAQLQDSSNPALAAAVQWMEAVQRQNYSGPIIHPLPAPDARATSNQSGPDAALAARLRDMLGPPARASAVPGDASLAELIRLGSKAQANFLSGRALAHVTHDLPEAVSLLDRAAALDPDTPNYARTADFLRERLAAGRCAAGAPCQTPALDFIRR